MILLNTYCQFKLNMSQLYRFRIILNFYIYDYRLSIIISKQVIMRFLANARNDSVLYNNFAMSFRAPARNPPLLF
jgi:hypothetical protein